MEKLKLIDTAFFLAIITIVYNLLEGIFSVFFGASDETLALLGFGIDSFVEVISGMGILHMIIRMKKSGMQHVSDRDTFEKQALRITGTSFYILAAGLIAGSVFSVLLHKKPETTLAGIIISVISLSAMFILMKMKIKTGKELNSEAIIADAKCTRTCFYLSFILLASSVLYELLGIAWFDIAGSVGIAWFAYKEGREAFEKAASGNNTCNRCDNR
ncbi:MAG: cation transporter [Bacteroidales bacterium]|nr:cation transporter [Bacteroidales bacterium]